ncbi:MAG TPA: hypothetical protein VL614_00545 [Acetobacteraceae bacterium]|jgi:hypothetical protein|nr:hypothetical protein [Acetobacteraceae bacterium]
MAFHKGDVVIITMGLDEVTGVVLLASANGRSLMLTFDKILRGHVGMMPVLQGEDGSFRSIVSREIVQLERVQ